MNWKKLKNQPALVILKTFVMRLLTLYCAHVPPIKVKILLGIVMKNYARLLKRKCFQLRKIYCRLFHLILKPLLKKNRNMKSLSSAWRPKGIRQNKLDYYVNGICVCTSLPNGGRYESLYRQ